MLTTQKIEPDRAYSTAGLAALLGKAPASVRRMRRRGELPAGRKVGLEVLVYGADLIEHLRGRA